MSSVLASSIFHLALILRLPLSKRIININVISIDAICIRKRSKKKSMTSVLLYFLSFYFFSIYGCRQSYLKNKKIYIHLYLEKNGPYFLFFFSFSLWLSSWNQNQWRKHPFCWFCVLAMYLVHRKVVRQPPSRFQF